MRWRPAAYEEKEHANDQEPVTNRQRQRQEQYVTPCDAILTLLHKVHDKVTNYVLKRIDSEIDVLLKHRMMYDKR